MLISINRNAQITKTDYSWQLHIRVEKGKADIMSFELK